MQVAVWRETKDERLNCVSCRCIVFTYQPVRQSCVVSIVACLMVLATKYIPLDAFSLSFILYWNIDSHVELYDLGWMLMSLRWRNAQIIVQKLLPTQKSDTQSAVCNWSYTCSKKNYLYSIIVYVEDLFYIWTSRFIEMPSKNVAWQQKITLRTILSGAVWIRRCTYVCWLESKWEKSSYKDQVWF